MEPFLLLVILVVLFIRWMIVNGRMERMEERVSVLAGNDLIERVRRLEQEVLTLRAASVKTQTAAEEPPTREDLEQRWGRPQQPAKQEVPAAVIPPLPPIPEAPNVAPAPPIPQVEPVPEPEFAPAFAFVPTEPAGPSFAERMRESMRGEEWEAIVGGNLLNKVGVLLFVIGLALLLGFSFTKVGPGGRAALGVGVSLGMLAGGFALEKRARYKIFARGLLGGGWAALYFTTYAMYAVAQTKVIEKPWIGASLLFAVASGMIAHSLRYRSQAVTGLAYFVAFVTLAITPVTAFSVVALVPLAASLLFIAHRFAWSEMALFGLIATYGTCAARGDSGAPLWSAQLIFSIYWLLFEGFDLLRAARRSQYKPWESAIFPLNALAFAGLSYVKWSSSAPQRLYSLAAGIAGAYLASAALRAFLRPPSSFAPEAGTLERASDGGYEGPVTLTAALTVTAIFLRFHGAWALVGLLAEAELFFLAGLYFAESYPRGLAAALFAGFAGKLLVMDVPRGGAVQVAGRNLLAWSPLAGLAALLFYINRALHKLDTFYGYAGSAMVALILGFEAPQRFLGPCWFALAAALFMFGWLRRIEDFRIQGYIGAGLALLGTSSYQVNVATGAAPQFRHPWISLFSAAVASYAGIVCGLFSSAGRLADWERSGLRRIGSWAATIALAALVWRIAPGDYLGAGWIALALVILELGLRRLPEEFRAQAYVVAALGGLRVLLINVLPIVNDGPLATRLILAEAAALAYLMALRLHLARRDANIFDVSSAAGTLFLLNALWALLLGIAVGPAWAVVALVLMEIGFALDRPGLRLQAHMTGAASFGRLFFANFASLGRLGVISHRLMTVAPVLISQYYQWSRQRRDGSRVQAWEAPLARGYLYAPAILAAVLLRFELGRALTVTGWAALALGLIFFGERWKNFDLRLQSYIMAALAFWRSWSTNLSETASFAGVSGRVWTGGFVIACLYAAQLLIPRGSTGRVGFERHARMFYSLLATALLGVLLYYEVSGSMLTVAWGLEGIALLIAGFPLNDRVLRLSGLTLFLVCILKLFLYDLRHLETLYRILSFIVLGSMLVSVSWIYTRFRERIQRYL